MANQEMMIDEASQIQNYQKSKTKKPVMNQIMSHDSHSDKNFDLLF